MSPTTSGRPSVPCKAIPKLCWKIVRASQVQEVRIAGDVPWVIGEPLASVGVLTAHRLLDQHAVRPVEQDDALIQ